MASSRTYRLITRIAESDAVETWRGVAVGVDQPAEPATIKILTPHAAVPEVIAALRDRVEAIRGISHPSLIVPWELGVAGGRTVLTSRHVLGHDLETVFQRLRSREVKLTVSRAVHLVAEAANAVAALHMAGQVHGALGPSDLFVGFDGAVRVSCAGLRPSLERCARTRQIATRGRRPYRAPELSRNVASAAHADVYALGAIVYELTCGKSLESSGPRGTSTRSDSLPPPSRIDRRVPLKLDAVILRALETARTRRYKDGAELREALWGYLDEMGDVVTPADLSAFAASVMPNEVVQKDFDPDEPCSGTPPIPDSFALSPLPAPAFKPAEGALPASVPIPAAEHTQKIQVAAVPGVPTSDATPMPTQAPDLSDPAARPIDLPAPGVSSAPAGMLSTAPPVEAEAGPPGGTAMRGDVFPSTVKMQAAPLHADLPARNGKNGAPLPTDTQAAAFDVPAAAEAADRSQGPDATDPDSATSAPELEPRHSTLATEYQEPLLPRRKMWPWLLLAGLAPILVAIGFLLGRQGSTTSPSNPPSVETLPPRPRDPRAPPRPHPTPVEPLPASPPTPPAPSPAPEPARAARTPDRGVALKNRKATKANRRRSRGRKRGRLSIVASHRARVYIDGKDTGRFTPLKGYLLPSGRHVVTLVQPSTGVTQKRTVRIRPGGRAELKVRFH